jgi:hypothetical protein
MMMMWLSQTPSAECLLRPIADIRNAAQALPMLRRVTTLGLLCVVLTSCSYGYNVLGIARGGRLAFIVDPKSYREPSCLRQVEVIARDGWKAGAEAGDDDSRVGYGTFWFQSVDYDDECANTFPIPYGSAFKGQPHAAYGRVKPKPLRRGVVYDVYTTTGATGYGSERFRINARGRVENLPTV